MAILDQKLNALVDVLIPKLNTLQATKLSSASPLSAANLTGTIDLARLPALPSANTVVGAATMSAIPATDAGGNGQDSIQKGTLVILADGRSFRYTGTGSKTLEASYIYIADSTPDWNTVQNKPDIATNAGVNTAVAAAVATKVDFGPQTLTAAQKTQVLTNINALAADYDPGDLAGRLTAGLTF